MPAQRRRDLLTRSLTPRLTDEEWEIAKDVCTKDQLLVLDYWRHGYGYKRIAVLLLIPRDAVRGRVDRARSAISRRLASSDQAR